jgi:hypothetical protein
MKLKRFLIIAILILSTAPLLSGCGAKPTWLPLWTTPPPGSTTAPPPTKNPNATYAPSDFFMTDTASMQNPSIVISKSKHTLEVYDGQTLMARMKVALGRTPGAKKKSGDNKTPEGDYYVCGTENQSRYYKSLYLSYPNSDDAYAGLNGKLITQAQYDSITGAIDRWNQPDWTTNLGGQIAISGTGTMGQGKTGSDWTAGNIVVSDKEMDYLYQYIPIKTDVQINP